MPQSTTTAKSCRPRSITCGRASPYSTRGWRWSAGTGSSATSSICRTSFTRVGIALEDILRYIAEHGERNARSVDDFIAERIAKYTCEAEPFLERLAERGLVIEVRSNRMPDGGLVTTFTDITPSVKAAEALERANATLERRVRERTGELTRLNAELEHAKSGGR